MSENCITCAIAAAADRITAYRLVRLIETGELQMSRLRDVVAQAAAVAPRRAAAIEDRARALIASESSLQAAEDEAFSLHETVLDDAGAALDDLKHALAPLTNNPPSEPSSASSAALRATHGQDFSDTFRAQAEAQIAAAKA